MDQKEKRLLLTNGESLISRIKVPVGGRAPVIPEEYNEHRVYLKRQIEDQIRNFIKTSDELRLGDEIVMCARLAPDFIAQSHSPHAIIESLTGIKTIGSRNYKATIGDVKKESKREKFNKRGRSTVESRLLFLSGKQSEFEKFLNLLEFSDKEANPRFADAVCKISKINQLTEREKISGSREDTHCFEIVFHRSRYYQEKEAEYIQNLLSKHGATNIIVRSYPNSPFFVSCEMEKRNLGGIVTSNMLRTIHSIGSIEFFPLRNSDTLIAPLPPVGDIPKDTFEVGLFDGGVDVSIPHLKDYVIEDNDLSVKTKPNIEALAHGTAVAGILLYGAMNKYQSTDSLPVPNFKVRSIRVFPTSDRTDVDLYEAIDIIEKTVKKYPEIKHYNLSFGPRGPIEDDNISRFTYVLDRLAHEKNISFYVAVGNDGDVSGFERIQAPSDMVNGLGVGAYTVVNGEKIRAPYSCKGPGRESGKIKPDLMAFGGSENIPFQLLALKPGKLTSAMGTSFSTPIVTALGASIDKGFLSSTPLLSRALLIHAAKQPGKDQTPTIDMGYGILPDSEESILYCSPQSVTVLCQGELSTNVSIKLKIPLPESCRNGKKIQVDWTVAALPDIDITNTSDYTKSCIESALFYNDKTRASIKQYRIESDLREDNLKWEPIVKKSATGLASSFTDPYIKLRLIQRYSPIEQIKYAIVVTVTIDDEGKDLYNEILRTYPTLTQIKLTQRMRSRIQARE